MIGSALAPEVDVACAVCGERDADRVCSEAQLEAQLEAARAFHARRLRRATRAAFEDRAAFTHDYPTRLLCCRHCGLLYRSPRPDAAAVLRAYREERYSVERLLQMIVSQRALFRPKAAELARWLGAGARVLEVGCFVGGFLREARDVGLIAAGLDPSEQLAILCRRSGLRVVGSTLESLATSARAERYDVVAIWNTFDQLPRPRAALAAALRVLQPGGMVIVRTPHGRYFRERVANGRAPRRALAWNNLLGFPYLHGYGLESIDRLALEFGLVRTRSVGDTLGTLADRTYSPWARLEERALKAAQRRALARDPLQAPWLDVYLRDARLARISHLPESAGQSRSAGF